MGKPAIARRAESRCKSVNVLRYLSCLIVVSINNSELWGIRVYRAEQPATSAGRTEPQRPWPCHKLCSERLEFDRKAKI
jgi:hypothetical protein